MKLFGKKSLTTFRERLPHFHRLQRKQKTNGREILWFNLGLALVLVMGLVFMFPRGRAYQFADLREGDVYVGEDVIAPFTFPINKTEEEYRRDLEAAAARVSPVFVKHSEIAAEQRRALQGALGAIFELQKASWPMAEKLVRAKEIAVNYGVIISDEELTQLLSPASNKEAREFAAVKERLLQIGEDLYAIGILDISKASPPFVTRKIALRQPEDPGKEVLEDLDYFYDLEEAKKAALEKLRTAFGTHDRPVRIGYELSVPFLKPNVLQDREATRSRVAEAVSRVPRAKGMVLEGERLLRRHERITREHLEKLRSLAVAKAEREMAQGGLKTLFPEIGKLFFITIALGLFALFLVQSRPDFLRSQKRAVLLALVLLLVSALAYIVNHFHLSPYLTPIPVASMIFTVFFDARTGFMGTISLSLLFGGMRGNEFNITIISLFVGTMVILAVRRVRSRTWLVKSILAAVGAYLFSITTLELLRYSPLSVIGTQWFYGAINGFFSPILGYGLVVIFEYLFKITTDMTLLELSDLNRPVLKRLAVQASGTYHHSILVGTLAEAAAEAIGANSLLARVGAYYHDIGKIEMPEYFVENQKGGKNPHEKLAPSMSCLILINHVRRGLEIAQQYKLPKEIQDIIAQHHGTTLISFFYQKALERSDGSEVNEADFRYPGPKPLTKEAAIVMLGDAVEATCRSLKDPTVQRIRAVVNSIIDDRFRESELDDCPLTLRDLTKITESFMTILPGILHARVEYPEQQEVLFRKEAKRTRERALES